MVFAEAVVLPLLLVTLVLFASVVMVTCAKLARSRIISALAVVVIVLAALLGLYGLSVVLRFALLNPVQFD